MPELFSSLPTNVTSSDDSDYDPGDPGVDRGADFHAGLHNTVNEAANILKATLGTDAVKGGEADVAARLDAMDAATADVATDLTTHLNDAVDAHDASAISITAISGIAATTVQAALSELNDDIVALGINGPPVDGGVADSIYGSIDSIDGGAP